MILQIFIPLALQHHPSASVIANLVPCHSYLIILFPFLPFLSSPVLLLLYIMFQTTC